MRYSPAGIARRYGPIAREKCERAWVPQLALSVLAGAYVALAYFAAHTVSMLVDAPGIARLIAALLFPVGLGMILVTGGELFTGDCLMCLAAAKGEASWTGMLRVWVVVYVGNWLGSLLVAALCAAAMGSNDTFTRVAVEAARAKLAIPVGEALARAVLCNMLVCTAVWMSYGTDSPAEKLIVTYFPVALFVLCGTEHCVANMYVFAAGYFAGGREAFSLADMLLKNQLPVTLGNIVGGALVYGSLLWLAYYRTEK